MRHVKYLFIILFFCACVQKQSGHPDGQNKIKTSDSTSESLFEVSGEDAEMNSAIANARKTLSQFDDALKSRDDNFDYFSIKKRFPTPNDGGEHIWINQIEFSKDGYKGIVNNEAVETLEVKFGDTVYISKKDITDWMYLDKNVLRGGYTLRVAMNHMSKKEKEDFLKEAGFYIDN